LQIFLQIFLHYIKSLKSWCSRRVALRSVFTQALGFFFLPAQQRPYTGFSFRFCFFFVTKELAFRRLACGSKAILLTKVMILPKSILLPKVISLPKVLAFVKGCLW
jgi:hypothetical protein